MRLSKLIVVLFLISTNIISAQIELENAFPNISIPNLVEIQNSNDGTDRLFLVNQSGIIYVIENSESVNEKSTFLDISEKVLFGGEQGLLGLAFHPDYKNNGYFFINYTVANPRRTIISRFRVEQSNANLADVGSEVELLSVSQPFSNHNGGCIVFGPDNYLYISFGDGGSGGDPQNNGQNLSTLLGSIIRIDPVNPSGDLQYSIPADNPFVGNSNQFREEIWAYGLRNVWKFSFDSAGKLIAADVGQNEWEEINIIEKGGNYGWRIMEAGHCYNPSSNCNTNGLEIPIWEYYHNFQGGFSITGGFEYQGISAPSLFGKYIYGDFVNGNIWALDYKNDPVENQFLFDSNISISTFGMDENGELYMANYGGDIYKFVETSTSAQNVMTNTYMLHQNYPNPFNPTTTIQYSVADVANSSTTSVKLKVYDLLGNEVAVLVNEAIP
ncbi:MAG: PQQ-dependent sugar dehydrogenase, partial [Melioribacteraceae bacterium]|nr:PQQ-dependent sugar dehydrogenase [Melioribacteraceae bacterium]